MLWRINCSWREHRRQNYCTGCRFCRGLQLVGELLELAPVWKRCFDLFGETKLFVESNGSSIAEMSDGQMTSLVFLMFVTGHFNNFNKEMQIKVRSLLRNDTILRP